MIPKRYARHYYDLFCFAKSEYIDKALEKIELLEKVTKFKQKFYPRTWAKYEDAIPEKIKLVPDKYRIEELEEDYKNMVEMFYENVPSFDEILDTISNLEEKIHKIK